MKKVFDWQVANPVGVNLDNNDRWARGNGRVMEGAARVLQYLPRRDGRRARYVELLSAMAASVSRVRGEDGFGCLHCSPTPTRLPSAQ
jgi:rhamnogalacturonyl hydrolase YesR